MTIGDMLKQMEQNLANKLGRKFNLNEATLCDDPCQPRWQKLGFYCWIEENGRKIASSCEEHMDKIPGLIHPKYGKGGEINEVKYYTFLRQMWREAGKFLATTTGSVPQKENFSEEYNAVYSDHVSVPVTLKFEIDEKGMAFYKIPGMPPKGVFYTDKLFVSPEAMKDMQEWDEKVDEPILIEKKINFREFL